MTFFDIAKGPQGAAAWRKPFLWGNGFWSAAEELFFSKKNAWSTGPELCEIDDKLILALFSQRKMVPKLKGFYLQRSGE